MPTPSRPAGAVGGGGEGLAAAVGGEAALAAELDEDAGRGHDGDAAGQGQVALAAAQRLRGQVQRDQRGGAGGVDGDRRALEAEGVGDAAGGDAAELPVPSSLRPGAAAVGVVLVHRRRRRRRSRCRAASAGSMPARSSASQATSSSSRCCGSIASASRGLMPKKLGVEVGGVVQEAALARVARAGLVGVGVVEALEVPAAVGGELRDARRAPSATSSPELLGRGDPAGVAAGHADDRDRLVARLATGAHDLPAVAAAPSTSAEQVLRRAPRASGSRRRGSPAAAGRWRRQPVAQLDRGERVEAELLEGPLGVDRLGGGVAEDGGDSARTRSRTTASRSPRGAAARRPGKRAGGGRAAPAARGPGREERRQDAGARPVARSAGGVERAAATAQGSARRASARRSRARPSLVGERADPAAPHARPVGLAEARRSCRSRCSHRPQASEVAGRPRRGGAAASASRKALAAA